MTCEQFPGLWVEKAVGLSHFYACRCPRCISAWPCPRDIKTGELVEIQDADGAHIGRVFQVLNRQGKVSRPMWDGMILQVDGLGDPKLPTKPNLEGWNEHTILWRRVLPPDRFERGDVL